jgi:hypothetical protein
MCRPQWRRNGSACRLWTSRFVARSSKSATFLSSTLHIFGAVAVSDSDPEDWFVGDGAQGFIEGHDGAPERADRGPTLLAR